MDSLIFSGIFFILDSENRLNLLGTKGNYFSLFGREISLHFRTAVQSSWIPSLAELLSSHSCRDTCRRGGFNYQLLTGEKLMS